MHIQSIGSNPMATRLDNEVLATPTTEYKFRCQLHRYCCCVSKQGANCTTCWVNSKVPGVPICRVNSQAPHAEWPRTPTVVSCYNFVGWGRNQLFHQIPSHERSTLSRQCHSHQLHRLSTCWPRGASPGCSYRAELSFTVSIGVDLLT